MRREKRIGAGKQTVSTFQREKLVERGWRENLSAGKGFRRAESGERREKVLRIVPERLISGANPDIMTADTFYLRKAVTKRSVTIYGINCYQTVRRDF